MKVLPLFHDADEKNHREPRPIRRMPADFGNQGTAEQILAERIAADNTFVTIP
jgi:hypothetical protein